MRDENHYRELIKRNPNAQVGISLAAAAVYAARTGVCEAKDRDAEYKKIHRELAGEHGETMSADLVLDAMDSESRRRRNYDYTSAKRSGNLRERRNEVARSISEYDSWDSLGTAASNGDVEIIVRQIK